jgi:hypothetical protein
MTRKRESYKFKKSYNPEQNLSFRDEKILLGLIYAHAQKKGIVPPELMRFIIKTYYRNEKKFPPSTLPPARLKPIPYKRERLTVDFRPAAEAFDKLVEDKRYQRKTLVKKIKEILRLYYRDFLHRSVNVNVDAITRLCIGGLTAPEGLKKNWYFESILVALVGVEKFRKLHEEHRWPAGISPGKR